ncbi:hypothetical protein M409DRAFT_25683 [Zasmidium cellare ATCC 36951]|uniref:Rhodopsin domain-containing protein n=1 Tax=Zasmidium cellare ATCC 36951 TaxID=1080233 RepID=A0A6A6CEQ1_ZASCE|nr:uncharacterized protein M409DRAFT_25683 [Zasmidium cellare ATCC 36951]KAF2163906.1 hypothetical protein M409DRAFT_25683 [Zasmidium cellare ATCC 36951]
MGSTQVYHDASYLEEVWALFGVGVVILIVRFLVRLRTVGLRQFQGDDYMSFVVLGCYTADAVTVTLVYLEGSNVDYIGQEERLATFNKAQISDVVHGSKMELVAWYTYTALIWGLKGCMLFFYNRLTFGLTQQTVVKALAVVSFLTYIAMFLTISLSCSPIRLNWQVQPIPPPKCTLRSQNFIVCTTLNVLTDAALLCVPLPLLWKLRIPIRKRITLSILLGSGIFIITAAIVRIVMTLGSHPSALTINRWGVRETIAGIAAVNAPIMKPMFKKSFWNREYRLRAEERNRRRQGSDNSGNGSSGKSSRLSRLNTMLRKPEPIELIEYSASVSKNSKTTKTDTTCGSKSQCTTARTTYIEAEGIAQENASQECFIQKPQRAAQGDGSRDLDIERAAPLHVHPGVLVDDLYMAPAVRPEVLSAPERTLEWHAGRPYRSSLL